MNGTRNGVAAKPKPSTVQNVARVRSTLALTVILLGTLGLGWATLLTASPAIASSQLLSTYPNAGQAIDEKLDKVTLTFSEAPLIQETLDTGLISVRGPAGEYVSNGSLKVVDGATISIAAKVDVPGEHTVDWRVVSSDGQPLVGSFTFTYAPPEEVATPITTPQPSPQNTGRVAGGQDTSHPQDGWTLGISIIALLVAIAAAGYTRSQAVAAKRALALNDEPHLVLTVGRASSIAAAGRKPTGGGPQVRLTNRGKGTAHDIQVRPIVWADHMETQSITQLAGGSERALGGMRQGDKVSALVTWQALDGKIYKKKLRTRP